MKYLLTLLSFMFLCSCGSTPQKELSFHEELAKVTKERVGYVVSYDGAYQKIRYPYGDVDHRTGVCSDVVIRSYREMGVDLQALVFSDMYLNYDDYPHLYNQVRPDPNIDHRRVPNLDIFFKKYGVSLPLYSRFRKGDILVWQSKTVPDHIAIVVDVRGQHVVFVHNQGKGLEYGSCISCSRLVGHYRF